MDQSIDARLAELEVKFGILAVVTQGALAILQDYCNGREIEIEQVEDLARALEPLLRPDQN